MIIPDSKAYFLLKSSRLTEWFPYWVGASSFELRRLCRQMWHIQMADVDEMRDELASTLTFRTISHLMTEIL